MANYSRINVPRAPRSYGELPTSDRAGKTLNLNVGNEPSKKLETVTTATGTKITGFEVTAVNSYWARRRKADAATAAAVILFFGLMEIIFDACFAFGNRRGLSYQEFRSRDWKERFRLVMNVGESPAQDIYAGLLDVQQRHRNVFTHALPTFYVPNAKLGWIPKDVKHLYEPRMNPLFAFDTESIGSTFKLFDEALALFENADTTWAACMFAKTPLPIPLASSRVAAILKRAVSREAFEKEIEFKLGRLDAFINGEC